MKKQVLQIPEKRIPGQRISKHNGPGVETCMVYVKTIERAGWPERSKEEGSREER